jgi:hypothetical protein
MIDGSEAHTSELHQLVCIFVPFFIQTYGMIGNSFIEKIELKLEEQGGPGLTQVEEISTTHDRSAASTTFTAFNFSLSRPAAMIQSL